MIVKRDTIIETMVGGAKRNTQYKWVDARELTRDDISHLEENYNISSELLADIMDVDEQSRIEKEDDYIALIIRVPALAEDCHGINQYTIPLGIVLLKDTIITICQGDSVILEDFAKSRFRQYPISTKEGFVISLIGRATMVYIRLLKYLNRQKDLVEIELHKSISNEELLQLLSIQKSLVYFTTSLTTNEILLEKLQKSTLFNLKGEEEIEFLEDVIIDNKQAIEMVNIYASILTGTMDTFASVISNNVNVIMKRLTIISIALMFPTFITSFYGMNIKLPLQNSVFAWFFMAGLCLFSAMLGVFFLSDKRSKKMVSSNLAKLERKRLREQKKRIKKSRRVRKGEKA